MPYSYLLFDVDEAGIALVSVNRPAKLNALSGAVVLELEEAFADIARQGAIRALILTGDTISAAEAHRIGLVNAVVPQAELLSYSRAWLGKVLANAPLALGLAMEAVDTGLDAGLDAGLRFEAAAFGVSAATEDR